MLLLSIKLLNVHFDQDQFVPFKKYMFTYSCVVLILRKAFSSFAEGWILSHMPLFHIRPTPASCSRTVVAHHRSPC